MRNPVEQRGLGGVKAEYLTEGKNSEVFRIRDDRIGKIYTEEVDLGKAILYKTATTVGRDILATLPQGFEVVVSGHPIPFRYDINPIDEIAKVEIPPGAKPAVLNGVQFPKRYPMMYMAGGVWIPDRFVNISPYVAGPRLNDFFDPNGKDIVEQGIAEIQDSAEQRFLRKLAKAQFGENSWFFGKASKQKPFEGNTLDKSLDEVAGFLGLSLGIFGIQIGGINVKVRADAEAASLNFVITDLCNNLGGLVHSPYVSPFVKAYYSRELEQFYAEEYKRQQRNKSIDQK